MDGNDRITRNPDILLGKPVIRGTRLSVEHISGLVEAGWSAADILRNYPGITDQDIAACIQYAASHDDLGPST